MRFVFVHQNYPGQFVHIVRHLLARGQHQVVFIGEPNANAIPGVRRVSYQMPVHNDDAIHPDARDFDMAMRRASAVAAAAHQVKQLGFEPDIVIGHHGWGELLNLGDVWPSTPLLGYQEYYYNVVGHDVGFESEFPLGPNALSNVRAKNAVNLLTLTNPGHGLTPTQYQLSTFPAWAQPNITVLPEGVDLDLCCPAEVPRAATIAGVRIAAGDQLVTYVARDLEPYRGFHILMRAIPALLRARKDARVIMVGGDGISYGARLMNGTWRALLTERLASELTPAQMKRVHFPGKVIYSEYRRLLQRSDTHVYMTYPFVASWSLREAMACGCAIVASDTAPVREFITDGKTGLLTPFHDPAALAATIVTSLQGGLRTTRRRAAARRFAETHMAMDDYLAGYEALIGRLTGTPVCGAATRPRRRAPGR